MKLLHNCALAWIIGLLAAPLSFAQDPHSFSNPQQVLVRHLDLSLTADFKQRQLIGSATLDIERQVDDVEELVLDTRGLQVGLVETSDGQGWVPASFRLGEPDPVLGRALHIALPAVSRQVRINYASSPESTGLQWLEGRQTAGGRHPYLYSQAQAIHARSFIPLQDSPQVRVTFNATIFTPPALRAVMSAGNDPQAPRNGVYQFNMPQPIPSYLIALAVGDLDFKAMGERTGVYAEAAVLQAAAAEFEDTEAMLEQVEVMYGAYRWDRYDLLILPPSFPWGGMENPRLSFITPTVIAGDKSLVGLIAHELAHSWSGNTVTNATWQDTWLNEGFTTYLTYRILEAVYGRERADMERLLGYQSLLGDLADLPLPDQRLVPDLIGRDPDAGFTEIPYEKGALLVTELEQAVGREAFDAFLRQYFDQFAFRSLRTEEFVEFLEATLVARFPDKVTLGRLGEWLHEPGLPANVAVPTSPSFALVDEVRAQWLAGQLTVAQLDTSDWTVHQWLHFLNGMPARLSPAQMRALDARFQLTQSSNNEVAHSWLLLAIRNDYAPAWDRLRSYLVQVGRRKLIVPLYKAMLETDAGRARATGIFAAARPGYQAVAVSTVDNLFRAE
ncbi:MAG: M1 family metallopeptidase [Halieaceae bacterium]